MKTKLAQVKVLTPIKALIHNLYPIKVLMRNQAQIIIASAVRYLVDKMLAVSASAVSMSAVNVSTIKATTVKWSAAVRTVSAGAARRRLRGDAGLFSMKTV